MPSPSRGGNRGARPPRCWRRSQRARLENIDPRRSAVTGPANDDDPFRRGRHVIISNVVAADVDGDERIAATERLIHRAVGVVAADEEVTRLIASFTMTVPATLTLP